MADGRAKNGGVRPGAGRKSKAEELGLQQLLDKCWTIEDREACLKKLSERASKGDLAAITLLLAYTYGKPTERVEHSGPQGGAVPIQIIEIRGPEGIEE